MVSIKTPRGVKRSAPMSGHESGNGFAARYSTIIQTITVVALFVGGIWAGVIQPLSSRVDELEKNSVTVRESKDTRDDFNRRFDELRLSILKLQDNQVPRTEHQEHWNEEAERIKSLRDNYVDLQKEFQSTYGVSDVIKTLQKGLDDLRQEQSRRIPEPLLNPH